MIRRLGPCVVVLLVVLLLGGCASLPESSAPQAIGTVDREPVSTAVPAPAPGREPDLLLRDFVAAGADPTDRHAAARRFLTPDAAARWDDTASTTIVDRIDLLTEARSGTRAGYVLRANRVGELLPGGVYRAVDGPSETPIRMVRVDGEWRIDELPPGMILERAQFFKAYQRRALYFLDPTGTVVTPDLRWIAVAPQEAAETLVEMLIAGPRAILAGAVSNQLAGMRLTAPITKADGRSGAAGVGFGGLRIELSGTGTLDQTDRERLASQVVWTLATADIPGPYLLVGDGKALDDRFPRGWTTADVTPLNPATLASSQGALHALRDGALVRVTSAGVEAMPGYFGTATDLRSVALSRDGKLAAAVSGTPRPAPEPSVTLMIGGVEGFATPVVTAATMTRPSWESGGEAVWIVLDGTTVMRVTRVPGGDLEAVPVDVSALGPLGSTITELRISWDGVRAAAVVDGKVVVTTVAERGDGRYALTGPRPIALGLGSPAVTLDWSTADSIVVARAASDIPVVAVAIDGSRMDALPSRNLTPPVTAVEATPASTFVADMRGVFVLNAADPVGDRYWREVPGLGGGRTIPVLPG